MNPHYQNLAYERTVIANIRRLIEEKYLEGGGGQKETMICESLPYEVRQVPNETFVEVVQRLQEEERRLTDEMAQYEFRKRDVRPLAPKPEPQQPVAEPEPVAKRPRGKGGKPRERAEDADRSSEPER